MMSMTRMTRHWFSFAVCVTHKQTDRHQLPHGQASRKTTNTARPRPASFGFSQNSLRDQGGDFHQKNTQKLQTAARTRVVFAVVIFFLPSCTSYI